MDYFCLHPENAFKSALTVTFIHVSTLDEILNKLHEILHRYFMFLFLAHKSGALKRNIQTNEDETEDNHRLGIFDGGGIKSLPCCGLGGL